MAMPFSRFPENFPGSDMGVMMTTRRNSERLIASGALAMAMVWAPMAARAQDSAPAGKEAGPEKAGGNADDIVVTGSRIVRSGFQSPTPLNVIGETELRTQSVSNNIADFVNTLPAVAGSTRPANSRLAISSGLAGINAINLRNLGTTRTLVLLDGHRSVGSDITGDVDVNDFPQDLIKRVEVVTGGASAAYGSDAVSGVVNFVLDKTFTGLRMNVESGFNQKGDGFNYKGSIAAGMKFAGGRGHFMVDGEWAHKDGIFDSSKYSWNQNGDRILTNPNYTASNGQPQYLVVSGAGTNNTLPGGIINSSVGTTTNALRGIYFGQNGSINRYNYGTTSNSTTSVGGSAAVADGNRRIGMDAQEDRRGVFSRASFEISPALNIYGEASYNWHHSVFNAGPSLISSAVLSASNPYVQQTLGSLLTGTTSITVGSSNAGFPYRINDNTRKVQRYVLGADGKFEFLGKAFRWSSYGQYGVTNTHEMERNIINNANLALALDAVAAPAGNALGVAAGTVVCRSTLTATTNGCSPLNILGTNVSSASALAYVLGNPYRNQTFKQTVAEANLSFDPFHTWAGAVSVSTGFAYRREQVSGYVPTEYQSGWSVGNFRPTFGSYDVKEGYIETAIPLGMGLNVNGAARFTGYSTSGYVTTWKGGATFQPIRDITLRFTRSRDIRAPNLNELYQAGTSRTNTLNDPFNSNAVTTFTEVTTGNTQLKAEISNTLTFGGVVQPRFIPGLSLSVDYYDIAINNAIGQVYSQEIVNRCYNGLTAYCSAITRTPTGATQLTVNLSPFNFSTIQARGIDFEASYLLPLSRISSSLPGELSLRGMATKYLKDYINNGIDRPIDYVGSMSDGVPQWIYRFAATYTLKDFTSALVVRGVSPGTISNTYTTCTTSCPASTTAYPTIDQNHVGGATYLDLSLSRKVPMGKSSLEVYFNITNLLDKDPPIIASGGLSTSGTYYDLLGRSFRMGLRFQL